MTKESGLNHGLSSSRAPNWLKSYLYPFLGEPEVEEDGILSKFTVGDLIGALEQAVEAGLEIGPQEKERLISLVEGLFSQE